MSKQLALSIALSVMAMTALALFSPGHRSTSLNDQSLRLPISAKAPSLPAISHLIPALQ